MMNSALPRGRNCAGGCRKRSVLDALLLSLGVGADLGIAFQLANIARDIVDDAHVGRIYLPAEWLRAEGLEGAALADPVHRGALGRIAQRLSAMADAYRRSARVGAARLTPGHDEGPDTLASDALDGTRAREVARYPTPGRIRAIAEREDGAIFVLEDRKGGRLLRLTPNPR